MEVSELKNICDERGIKRVAMVDDVFDVPDKDYLDREQYFNFRERYNSDQELKRAVTWVSGMNARELPRFEDLSEDILSPLWRSLWKSRINGRKLKGEHSAALKSLFQDHGHNVLGMLDTVVKLLSLFRNHLEVLVTMHGTDFEADEVARAEIVLVDYFLGQNLHKDQYLKEAIEVVEKIVDAARSENRPIPSFLLVSSRSQEIDEEKFRRHAKLMKSRFRFFSKEALDAGYVKNVENIINLHDLIDASDRTEKIERLIEDWRDGAKKAVSSVYEQMLELDVSDLVYLDCFRLTHEGTSIANYLRWFLTASLGARVTDKLTKSLWGDAATLKLFSVINGDDYVDTSSLIKTFDGPSNVIAHAYGDILFDKTRGVGDCAFPAELSGHDLFEGDFFVRPKGQNRKNYRGARVCMVMTPSCDLISRADNEELSAKSVLLLSGTLDLVTREDEKNNFNFTKDYFVYILENEKRNLFQIKWDFTHPISVDWSKMCDEGPGKGFKRLGRVRNLYFHKIRDEFANHFTRIGTEIAPLFPHSRNGKVFMKVKNTGRGKKFECVMDFTSAKEFVWETGPILQKKGRSKKIYLYQGSRKFVSELVEALRKLRDEKPELTESVNSISNHLTKSKNYMDILRPMKNGYRGETKTIEFKKTQTSPCSASDLSSQADLIITTSIEESPQT